MHIIALNPLFLFSQRNDDSQTEKIIKKDSPYLLYLKNFEGETYCHTVRELVG